MSTAVKRINESMRGAPVLNCVAGAGITLLDTFLVNGWGLATALSGNISGNICTINMNVADTFEDDCVVAVTAGSPAQATGEFRLTQGGNVLKFPISAPDGPLTGTITVKYASAGWDKVFSAANRGVYRSRNVMGPRRYLLAVDSAISLRVTGYNAMTSATAGTGPFPTAAQVSGGGYWPKGVQADSRPERYDMVADDRLFYFAPAPIYAANGATDANAVSLPRFFGDPVALRTAGDAWVTALSANKGNEYYSSDGVVGLLGTLGNFVERIPAGTGSAVELIVVPEAGTRSTWSGADVEGFGAFPGAIDGRLRLSRLGLPVSQSDFTRRAILPGAFSVPHSGLIEHPSLRARDTVPGTSGLAGRKLMLLWVGSNNRNGGIFIDTTGPWR